MEALSELNVDRDGYLIVLFETIEGYVYEDEIDGIGIDQGIYYFNTSAGYKVVTRYDIEN